MKYIHSCILHSFPRFTLTSTWMFLRVHNANNNNLNIINLIFLSDVNVVVHSSKFIYFQQQAANDKKITCKWNEWLNSGKGEYPRQVVISRPIFHLSHSFIHFLSIAFSTLLISNIIFIFFRLCPDFILPTCKHSHFVCTHSSLSSRNGKQVNVRRKK